MEQSTFLRSAILFVIASASGCAAPSDYPSLALRPAERADYTATDDAPAPPLDPVPPEMLARTEVLLAEARAANQAFERLEPRVAARVAAARSSAIASNAWSSAQVAMAELDLQRSRTAAALAELDLLFAQRAIDLQERTPIDQAREQVAAILAEQDAALLRLRRSLQE